MMQLKILVLDDIPRSVEEPFYKLAQLFQGTISVAPPLPDDASRSVEEPFHKPAQAFTAPPILGIDCTKRNYIIFPLRDKNKLEIELQISKTGLIEDAETFINECTDPYDLVLIDDAWPNNTSGGHRRLLPLAYEKIQGTIPGFPCFAVFTREFEDTVRIQSLNAMREQLRTQERKRGATHNKLVTILYKSSENKYVNALMELIYQVCHLKRVTQDKFRAEALNASYGISAGFDDESAPEFRFLAGKSVAMRILKGRLHRIAKEWSSPGSKRPVVFLGPPGSGKTEAARELAFFSGREGKFQIVDCSQVQNENFTVELFGSRKGDFTGAENLPGKLALAASETISIDARTGATKLSRTGGKGGMILFDEFDALTKRGQEVLRSCFNLGLTNAGSGHVTIHLKNGQSFVVSDVAFVFASNKNIKQLRADCVFIDDLADRLDAAHEISLPGLDVRESDMLLILEKHLTQEMKAWGASAVSICFSPEAQRAVAAFRGGNLRKILGELISLSKVIGLAWKESGHWPEISYALLKDKMPALFSGHTSSAQDASEELGAPGFSTSAEAKADGVDLLHPIRWQLPEDNPKNCSLNNFLTHVDAIVAYFAERPVDYAPPNCLNVMRYKDRKENGHKEDYVPAETTRLRALANHMSDHCQYWARFIHLNAERFKEIAAFKELITPTVAKELKRLEDSEI